MSTATIQRRIVRRAASTHSVSQHLTRAGRSVGNSAGRILSNTLYWALWVDHRVSRWFKQRKRAKFTSARSPVTFSFERIRVPQDPSPEHASSHSRDNDLTLVTIIPKW